jgi:hypothetical protein
MFRTDMRRYMRASSTRRQAALSKVPALGRSNRETTMTNARTLTIAALATGLLAAPALAQTAGSEATRDAVQQQRIENGLQSGQLTTHEAGKLEREETQVDRIETKALKDGTLSSTEAAKVDAAQNRVSKSIAVQKHDAQTGNPNSASSRRMQADVQRNANQQARIAQGTKTGTLGNNEVASLEHGQTRVDRAEANAAANGRVGAVGEARIQGKEGVQSARIYRKKHD